VGELLDGAFTAIRRHPRVTLGLAALVMLFVSILTLVLDWALLVGVEAPADNATWDDSRGYFGRLLTRSLAVYGIESVGTLVLTGLITAVIGQAVLGRSITPAEAWARLRPLIWRLLAVSVLTHLILIGIAVAALVPAVVAAAAGGENAAVVLFVVGVIAWIALSVYAFIALALAPAALVLEQQTVRGALSRSRALVRRSWWRVFGILVLASLIASVIGGIISLPFGLAGGGLSSFSDTSTLRFTDALLAVIGSLVAGTLVQPYSAGVRALLYIDRRIRAEALDVALTRAATETVAE
jgi:hypothetical protein